MRAGLVEVAGCFSGVLGKHPTYRRVFLATPRAMEAVRASLALRRTIRDFRNTDVLKAEIFKGMGICPECFSDREKLMTIGLHAASPAEDRQLLDHAKEKLPNPERGIHRLILFRMMGINISEEAADLPPNHYAYLQAHLWQVDPSWGSIEQILLKERGAHDFSKAPETITFSRSHFERDSKLFGLWSHIDTPAFMEMFQRGD
jgi:hypothetical protein